jgi:hypothetical protein
MNSPARIPWGRSTAPDARPKYHPFSASNQGPIMAVANLVASARRGVGRALKSGLEAAVANAHACRAPEKDMPSRLEIAFDL